MTKLFATLALSIALPAIAHAAPAPAKVEAKKDCCAEMKGKECCCEKMKHDAAHAGHDMPAASPAPHAH